MKNPSLILSTRTRNVLFSEIMTMESLEVAHKWRETHDPKVVAKFTSRQLMRAANFGKTSLAEVIAWLDEYDMHLADNPQSHRCPQCGQIIRTYHAE